MEKLKQREDNLPEYPPQVFSYETSPNTPNRRNSDDLDFNDVFGGPPRNSSTREMRSRYGFSEPVIESEKPVFGEEIVARRRNTGDNFFDDIFRGEDSYNSPRIFSPVKPLPPAAEIFATSLPTQLSLPAKSTKAVEYPTFASHANGLNSPRSSRTSLSTFSMQKNPTQEETRNDFYPFYRAASYSSDDSPSSVASDTKENVENLKKGSAGNVENQLNPNNFHFSIYKWAGVGVPMLMPLKDIKADDNLVKRKSSKTTNQELSENANPVFSRKESEKNDYRSNKEAEKVQNPIEETFCDIFDPKSRKNTKEEGKPLDEIDTTKKVEKEFPLKKEESFKPELKSLHAWFSDDDVEKPEVKENKTSTLNGAENDSHVSKNVKKNKEAKIDDDANKNGENGVNVNKVKDFVHIYNQEPKSRPKYDVLTRNRSYRRKPISVDQKEKESSLNTVKVKGNVNLHIVEKKPDVSPKVDENLNKSEAKLPSHIRTPSYRKSFRKDSAFSVDNLDDHFGDYFLVEELSHDQESDTQTSEASEEIKALDAKIRQWSAGKKGNIRSLLSTLQSVLWPGSGWKPVPLVDLIESNSVKRTYQKALLRLHPDKLQQNSAADHQKYIAEKVFDILQEAWDHFNTL